MKILLLEDDLQLNLAINTYLKSKDYSVDSFEDGEEALDAIEEKNYDLFILDINVPSIDGLDLLSFIRKTNLTVPIIIITASLEINNLTQAFDSGCSEYIKKPFHLKELEVRLSKLFDQNDMSIKLTETLHFNKNTQEVTFNEQVIQLRKKELRLIELLALNINKPVTYEEIIDYVWENEIKEEYPIRQLVNSLRRKIPVNIIKTVFGIGYKIEN